MTVWYPHERVDHSLQSITEMQATHSYRSLVHSEPGTPSLHDMTGWYPHERADHSLQSSTEMEATLS
jgi:hypothetical protein